MRLLKLIKNSVMEKRHGKEFVRRATGEAPGVGHTDEVSIKSDQSASLVAAKSLHPNLPNGLWVSIVAPVERFPFWALEGSCDDG